MKKVEKSEYKNYIQSALECTANRVYPLSIAEGIQEGEIFTDDQGAVLFWHYCGFAYISGNAGQEFLKEVYRDFLHGNLERRFVLITDEEAVVQYLSSLGNLQQGKRVEYSYDKLPEWSGILDGTFEIERIAPENIAECHGRIVPSFSWTNEDSFFANGFGYAAKDKGKVVASAFSSAVSSNEIDIGVETDENYRHKGLASFLSYKMCEEIVRIGKRPVWAHAESNVGSGKTAARVGFIPDKMNIVVQRRKDG